MKQRGTIAAAIGFGAALLAGWYLFPIVLYRTSEQPMQFSHKVHAEEAGMPCEDCHALADDGRFQGTAGLAKCSECHSAQLGETEGEKILVEQYVATNREIPWLVYSRQPDNAWFPHASHIRLAGLACEECHGQHGYSSQLRVLEVNRISGYSRDIWGANISGFPSEPWQGMKMTRCVNCHEENGRRDGCIDCHK